MGKEIRGEKIIYICVECGEEITSFLCGYNCKYDAELIRHKDKVKEVKLEIVTTVISERLLSEEGG